MESILIFVIYHSPLSICADHVVDLMVKFESCPLQIYVSFFIELINTQSLVIFVSDLKNLVTYVS